MGVNQECFVKGENIPDHLKCQICLLVLETPIRLGGCVHYFCKGCIRDWFTRRNRTCPTCRAIQKNVNVEALSRHPDPLIVSLLDNEERYCSQRDKKCYWTGPSQRLQAHLADDCLVQQSSRKDDEIRRLKKQLDEMSSGKDDEIRSLMQQLDKAKVIIVDQKKTTIKAMELPGGGSRGYRGQGAPGDVGGGVSGGGAPPRRDFERNPCVVDLKCQAMSNEYLVNKDVVKLVARLEELPATKGYPRLVDMAVSRVVMGEPAECNKGLVEMLVGLACMRRLTPTDFERGLLPLLEFMEEVAKVVPLAYGNLGDALGPFLLQNCVGVHWVLETARRFRLPVAKVACAALDSMLRHPAGPEIACNFCHQNQLRPIHFCASEAEARALLAEKNYWAMFPYMKPEG
mmetsp:Transcript_11010/g.17878  ORF Transcript_11010/g.17878 Transcript_11010/m.17878 type:complete len:401 (+) Transcript_11010:85-1287(+)